jgi:CRISPR-associated protein Cas2
MRYVIAFDVSDDRRRYRLVRVLLGYAKRVQKSVFEAPELRRAAYLRLRSLAEGTVDPATDSLRYYFLCEACADRIEFFGKGPGHLDRPDGFEVI